MNSMMTEIKQEVINRANALSAEIVRLSIETPCNFHVAANKLDKITNLLYNYVHRSRDLLNGYYDLQADREMMMNQLAALNPCMVCWACMSGIKGVFHER